MILLLNLSVFSDFSLTRPATTFFRPKTSISFAFSDRLAITRSVIDPEIHQKKTFSPLCNYRQVRSMFTQFRVKSVKNMPIYILYVIFNRQSSTNSDIKHIPYQDMIDQLKHFALVNGKCIWLDNSHDVFNQTLTIRPHFFICDTYKNV